MASIVTREVVASVDVFKNTSAEFLDAVAVALHTTSFSPGEFIYHADTPCKHLNIIASGTLEVVKLDPVSQSFEVEDSFGSGEAVAVMVSVVVEEEARLLEGRGGNGDVIGFALDDDELLGVFRV